MEECIALAEELAELMGADWLTSHSAQPHRNQHVIAAWLELYRRTPPERLSRSQQLLQIGELMSNIRTLRNAGTQNLETRIDDLRLDDRDRVASAIHEIRAAAEYAHSGRRVLFISEASVRTPDFLVDDCLEVECKHKSGISSRDKARFDLYGILHRRLRAVFPEHVPYSALLLETMFHVEPRRELIDNIVEAARAGLRRPQPSQFSEIDDGQYTAHFEVRPAGSGTTHLFLPRGVTKFDQMLAEGIPDSNGNLNRVINLKVGCEVRQDRVKGVLKSVRSAARQFSGRYPAVVCVDISGVARKGTDEQLAHLRDDILAVLKSHTTISRVELSTTKFVGDVGEQTYYTSIQEIDNPDARFPIGGS